MNVGLSNVRVCLIGSEQIVSLLYIYNDPCELWKCQILKNVSMKGPSDIFIPKNRNIIPILDLEWSSDMTL